MIRALWNEQVPVAGADRLKLGENIAVLDLMALAQFALMPEDDHALACILKSPVLSQPLTEDELMAVAAGRGAAFAVAEPAAADGAAFRCGCGAAARRSSRRRPAARPFEFLSGVLAKSRLRFVSRLGSAKPMTPSTRCSTARSTTRRRMAPRLQASSTGSQAGEIEIKRNMEQGAGEVRVMTVHGAKGLEAPIVILPDTAGGHESTCRTRC